MPSIDAYRKRAKQLVRWHRAGNHSVGGRVRALARFRHLADADLLAMPLPLTLAQEVVAAEAGYPGWEALRAAGSRAEEPRPPAAPAAPVLARAVPVLFVRDAEAAARHYRDALGFAIDFLHGEPPFYASVSRGGACLHLRRVGRPNFAELAAREESLILATVAVSDAKALFDEYAARGVELAQRLERQAWGGLDFQARDPDGNVIHFVEGA